MPELPEVETVRRGLARQLEGRVLQSVTVRRRDLRLPIPQDFESRTVGARVLSVGRRAKYLTLALDSGALIIGHLGMTGRFCVVPLPLPPAEKHDHVIFVTDAGQAAVFSDPRRFGLLVLGRADRPADHPLLKDLGPEPLSPDWTAAQLLAKLRPRRSPLKALLLDQGVVAGLGNIYVCEALWRARLSPERTGSDVSPAQAAKLHAAVRAVLQDALAAGGSTLRDYVQADGQSGGFQNLFSVYDRQGSRCAHSGCRGTIERTVQAGRSTYFCPRCQR